MRRHTVLNRKEVSNVTAIFSVCILLLLGATAAFAQTPALDPPAQQQAMTGAVDQNKQLADQITELSAEVARLQSAVQRTGPGKKVSPKSGMKMSPLPYQGMGPNQGMGMMDEKSGMGMPPGKGAMTSGSAAMGTKGDQGEMGGNAPMSPGDKDEMSGMSGSRNITSPAPAMGTSPMGEMAPGGNPAMKPAPPAVDGMAKMSGPSSATPSQASVSHLYHIGSNGFFLNHSRHVTLTPDQTLTLHHVKEKAMLDRASEQRRIDEGEQELYTLTGADQPDNTRIQTEIFAIEKLRADQRMNFIRAVADASNVLTPEQRKALIGNMAAAGK